MSRQSLAMASARVRRFVERRITDVVQLDILICLQREPSRYWDEAAVARRLRLSVGDAARGLESLARHGLLDVRLDASLLYRFSPTSSAITTAAMDVAAAYQQCRHQVRALVTSRHPRQAR